MGPTADDYENFNPAVDALDAISADLEAACSGVDRMIVDDDGRIRQLQPDRWILPRGV